MMFQEKSLHGCAYTHRSKTRAGPQLLEAPRRDWQSSNTDDLGILSDRCVIGARVLEGDGGGTAEKGKMKLDLFAA